MTRLADRLLSLFVPTTSAAAASSFCEYSCSSSYIGRMCYWVWQSGGGYVKQCRGCGTC